MINHIDILWQHEDKRAADYVDVPRWIEQDIDAAQIAAILQGGCESGAYMPAVTYSDALATMSEHGDDVLQLLEDTLGELPPIPDGSSWSGIAVRYLSAAVELWASMVEAPLAEAIEEEGEGDDA